MPGAVGDQQVLWRHAELRRQIQCCVDVRRLLQLHQHDVVAARLIGDPRQRQRRSVDIAGHDRSPAGVIDLEDRVRLAFDLDMFVVAFDGRPAFGHFVAMGVGRIA